MAPSTCVICGRSPANNCTSCKSAGYCSKACQQLDWPLHKTLCKNMATPPTRPKPTSKLAILLSADNPEPQLIWVSCPKIKPPGSKTAYDSPIVEPLLGNPVTHEAERFNISENEVRGYKLDHTVVLYARDNWLNDGSKPNQAALALTNWELPYDWRGNILIMSYKGAVGKDIPAPQKVLGKITLTFSDKGGQVEPFKDFQNVTLGDLRTAVDYLNRYGMNTERGTEHSTLRLCRSDKDAPMSELERMMEKIPAGQAEAEKQRKVKGVLIRCEGDISVYRKQIGRWEKYSEVAIGKDHSIWKEDSTSASKIMGLPLLVQKLPANPAWNQHDHTRFDNQSATFLNLEVNPKYDREWGFAPPKWQAEVGSVLLVRKDGKDLSREQAWALAEYMQFRVSDSFEEAMESGDKRRRRAAVLKMLNWKNFDSFLEDFKVEMMVADGKHWANVKSPFGTRESHLGESF